MARAICYTRFSTPEQMKGHSQERQDGDIRRFAEEHDLTIDESLTFRDTGISAHKGRHRSEGKLGDFLAAVEKRLVRPGDWLLVEDFDRLSREEMTDALDLFLQIIKAGVTIATVRDGQLYDRQRLRREPHCVYAAIAKMQLAFDESDKKSDRVRKAWTKKLERAADGKPLSTGKRTNPWWLEVRDGKFVPIPEKVAVVNGIFHLAANGLGRHAIIKELGRRGIKAPRGGPWAVSTLGQLLMGDQVLGFFQSRQKTPPIPGYYPIVVSADLVADARAAIIARRSRETGIGKGPKGDGFKNLFSGVIFCGCGAPMWYRDRGQKGGVELVCSSHHSNRGQCPQRGHNYRRFEERFREHIAEVDLTNLERGQDEERDTLRKDIANLGMEAQRKREQAGRLTAAVAEAATKQAPAVVMDTITRLEREANECDRQRRDKESVLASKANGHMTAAIEAIKRAWPEDYAGRAALSTEIHRVVERIVFYGKIATIYVKGKDKRYFMLPVSGGMSMDFQFDDKDTKAYRVEWFDGMPVVAPVLPRRYHDSHGLRA